MEIAASITSMQSSPPIPPEIDKGVAREIAAFMRRTGWSWWCIFLNNFWGHLPGGFYRSFPEDIRNSRCANGQASIKRRALSLAQFHSVVDRLIRELGLDEVRIQELVETDNVEGLYIYVVPLYARLRAEGFKRYPDLTA